MKAFSLILAASLVAASVARAHDSHETFAAGTPGDPAKPARVIDLTIVERADGTMSFGPTLLRAERDEQISFLIRNDGKARHEFRLDSAMGNAEHKAMMARMPDMVHSDSNATTIAPGHTARIVWRFSKPGTYEFACLLPGHYEAGMHGAIIVGH